MKFMAISYNEFDYTKCLSLVSYAQSKNQKIRAHNLIWGAPSDHNPKFIQEETNATKLENFMIRYIKRTVKTMGDYPHAWDVVNEAVSDDATGDIIKMSPWSFIDDYICKAFKAAKEANPNIKLFYNDYKHASMTGIYKTKSDRVFELVKTLKTNGCGIDGVGFQSHIDIEYAEENFESIRANIKRYNDIGVWVHFTEIDVRCKGTGNRKCPYNETWPE